MDTVRFGRLFIAVGALVALILGGVGVGILIHQSRIANNWVSTEGTVVDVVRSRDSDGDTMYKPVVAYTTPEGEQICETNVSSSSRPGIGDSRTVYYDPADPSACSIKGGGWVPWMLLGMAAFFLLIFGGVGLAVTRSRAIAYPAGNDASSDNAEPSATEAPQAPREHGDAWPTMPSQMQSQNRKKQAPDDLR